MPLFRDPAALHEAVEQLAAWIEPRKPDVILGAEARGFVLGAALAYRLGIGFVAARKPGKLPHITISAKYALEYGVDSLEIHADAHRRGHARARARRPARHRRHRAGEVRPVEQLGGDRRRRAFLIELAFLDGRARLAPLRRALADQLRRRVARSARGMRATRRPSRRGCSGTPPR